MTLRIFLALAIAAAATATAHAQWNTYGMPGYHSSTYEEGVMRGFGAAVQSVGQANLYNSAAAQNWEQARSMNLDNRLKATDTYFELRAKNKAYTEAERGPRATQQELAVMAHSAAPDRLQPTQLDPLTGAINWPRFLRGPEYAEPRTKLDKLYSMRASSLGAVSSSGYMDAIKLVEEMQGELKKHVAEYPPQEYSQSKKFLQSLQNELRFPTG